MEIFENTNPEINITVSGDQVQARPNVGVAMFETKSIQVPIGHDVVFVKKEFSVEAVNIKTKIINDLTALSLKSLKDAKDIDEANKELKAGKRFIKDIGESRLTMSRVLKDKSDDLINYERTFLADVVTLVDLINKKILTRQLEIKKEEEAESRRIAEEKQKQLEAQQAEDRRVASIKELLFRLENDSLRALNSATIETIDEMTVRLKSFVLPEKSYQEFLPQAVDIQNELIVKFRARKLELENIAELEKINASQAEELKRQAEVQNAFLLQELQAKAEADAAAAEDQQLNSAMNIQMEAELKQSMLPKAGKGLTARWTFAIADPLKVPYEYLMPNEAKIKEAVKAGVREIEGVNIYQDYSNSSR